MTKDITHFTKKYAIVEDHFEKECMGKRHVHCFNVFFLIIF